MCNSFTRIIVVTTTVRREETMQDRAKVIMLINCWNAVATGALCLPVPVLVQLIPVQFTKPARVGQVC